MAGPGPAPLTTSNASLSRMRLKQSRLKQIPLMVSFGMFEVGKAVAEEFAKRAADSPLEPYPIYEGLPRQVGVLVYVSNQKIHGWSRRGDQPRKPRKARSPTRDNPMSVVTFVGVGFPGRFAEHGTLHSKAHPAFTPARDATIPRMGRIIVNEVEPRIGRRG